MNQPFGNRYLLGAPVAGTTPYEVFTAQRPSLDSSETQPPMSFSMTMVERRLANTPGVEGGLREQFAQAAQIQNPGLAVVHDVVRDGSRLGLVTTQLPPRTLRDLLNEEPRILPAQVAALGAETAAALADLHAAHILHLAVCPENIRLDGPAALLTGYGLDAVRVQFHRSARDEITAARPTYTAPEVTRGRAIGAGVDVYALGAIPVT